jgi:hypothetical protein
VTPPDQPSGPQYVTITPAEETDQAMPLDYRLELGLSEIRLAVLGIVLGVGLSAAAIGLAAGGWVGGLVAGIWSVVAVVVVRGRGGFGVRRCVWPGGSRLNDG